jgi:hypothetical protein
MRVYRIVARAAVNLLSLLSFVVTHFQQLILFESEQETLKQRRYSLMKLQQLKLMTALKRKGTRGKKAMNTNFDRKT